MRRKTIKVLSLLISLLGLSQIQAQIRIMPLGDSNTEGHPSANAYRPSLKDSLNLHGYCTDFVGKQSNGSLNDKQHNGYGGWKADRLRDSTYSWLNQHPAEIVLVLAGTNDLNNAQTVLSTIQDLDGLLNQIDQWETDQSKSVVVVMANLINCATPSSPLGLEISALNTKIDSMVSARNGSGDLIVAADLEPTLNYSTDMFDFLHPNTTGYAKMTSVWFPAVQSAIQLLQNQPEYPGLSGGPLISSSPSPVFGDNDCLTCGYSLDAQAEEAAVSWTLNGQSILRHYLPMKGDECSFLKDYADPTAPILTTDKGNVSYDGSENATLFGFGPGGSVEISDGQAYQSYTKTAWIKLLNTPNSSQFYIISGQDHLLRVNPATLRLRAGHNGNQTDVQAAGALSYNTWYFVSLTYDHSAQVLRLYLDGSEVDSQSGVSAPANGTPRTYVGANANGSGNPCCFSDMYIREARVYHHVLSPQQIQMMHSTIDKIVAEETQSGESWACQVVPLADDKEGNVHLSTSVTIDGFLPILLNYFQASSSSGSTVQLSWESAWELDVSHFGIERSATGRDFIEIDRIPSQGNSPEAQFYQYHDLYPLAGANYYRLAIWHRDGAVSYSDQQFLLMDKSLIQIQSNLLLQGQELMVNGFYPNDFNGQAVCFDVTGRKIWSRTLSYPAGSFLHSFDTHGLRKGIYILHIYNGQKSEIFRFQVE